jgi:nucleoid-associated protein YgaU
MLRIVGGDASGVIDSLVSVRADVELGIRNAMTVLDFEAWSRGLRSQMQLLRGTTNDAAAKMEERAFAKAVGIYRPRAGESLYKISNQVYGTPFAWKVIYERNGLTNMRLDGTELLIIPERSAA